MKRLKKLKIIYEDKDIIVIDKESNKLVVGTERNHDNTLFYEVSDYVKKQHKSNKIFIVHRLDKDTSGLIIFAKSIESKTYLQENWSKFTKNYKALVHGKMEKKKDTIINYLNEDKFYNVFITDKYHGKESITKYETVKSNNKYSLLNINILTGRKNQIRVALSSINHPIVGDKKYGTIKTTKRLMLHASYLKIIHPRTKKELEFSSNPVNFFEIK